MLVRKQVDKVFVYGEFIQGYDDQVLINLTGENRLILEDPNILEFCYDIQLDEWESMSESKWLYQK